MPLLMLMLFLPLLMFFWDSLKSPPLKACLLNWTSLPIPTPMQPLLRMPHLLLLLPLLLLRPPRKRSLLIRLLIPIRMLKILLPSLAMMKPPQLMPQLLSQARKLSIPSQLLLLMVNQRVRCLRPDPMLRDPTPHWGKTFDFQTLGF